ncbi:MAG: hypothetical protein NC205_02770 [Prevotella sp.]|nr:hypothetical protein [Alistipes senegalensis]MCM1357492.1 hypothetical protein [Prevotella sp.]MCM1472428.1 hypothetical protein [Muribaculaceae bacterium]
MKKFIILACAFMLACVSCSEESSGTSGESKNMLVSDNVGDGINVNKNEMPFGATMTDLYPDDVPIAISYENRFMTADEAKKISDYISAVNTCDVELMQKTCYPSYLEYLVEQYENTDVQNYLDTRHQTIASTYTNGEFDFNYILINSLMDENNDDSDTGFSQLDTKIHEKSPDAEITSRKMVGIDVLYSLENDDGSYSLSMRTGSDMILYIYTIDGQIYIL